MKPLLSGKRSKHRKSVVVTFVDEVLKGLCRWSFVRRVRWPFAVEQAA